MNKHCAMPYSPGLDVADYLKKFFVAGEIYPIRFRGTSPLNITKMIEFYRLAYPNTLPDSFQVPHYKDGQYDNAAEALTAFARLVVDAEDGDVTIDDVLPDPAKQEDPMRSFTEERMASAIFVHLYVFVNGRRNFQADNYGDITKAAHARLLVAMMHA